MNRLYVRMVLLTFITCILVGCGECRDSMKGGAPNILPTEAEQLSYIEVDILLVSSGQSNSTGQAYSFQYEELPNTYFFSDGYWYANKPYIGTGPEASLINTIAAHYPNKTIGIIKYTYGATSIYAWRPDWVESDVNIQLNSTGWYLYDTLVSTIIDATSKTHRGSVDAFFWMQGETDAANEYYSLEYANTFTTFIQSLRNDIGYTTIVSGLISPNKSSIPYVHNVRDAQSEVANTLNDIYLVDTAVLDTCCDNLHFTIIGQKTLGELFANMYLTT